MTGDTKSKFECSICKQQFLDSGNSDIELQKKRHEQWHSNCISENRNTAEGKVEWNEILDN
jgi:hypothetical protein